MTTDPHLVQRFRQEVADALSARRSTDEVMGRPPLSLDDQRQFAQTLLGEGLERYAQECISAGTPVLEPAVEDELAESVMALLFGLGRLQPLVDDPDIENININGCDRVWLKYADGSKRVGPAVADSDAELIELIRVIGSRMGLAERRFDSANPQLDLQLPDGSRLSAVMGVSARPALSIRRHRLVRVTLDDLVDLGAIDEELKSFLAATVRARKNLIVAGGTNAGKTTMLRALASEIPADERLVTIENSLELGLDTDPELHPDAVALEAREANTEGEGAITMAQLVRRGLRMDPSRVIVGEVLGEEVLSMLEAMSQGNDGSMCTIHANSSDSVFRRIATYAIKSAERLPVEATNLLIAGAIDFVVFIDQRDETPAGGRHHRYVSSVREVIDAEGTMVVSNEVFQPGPDGRAVPGAPIRCQDDLMLHGYSRVLAGGWA
ncbi:MAG TPA: ATPase, T2SS/T4P/T4SS family [Actinomycetes bacterium]|nr:ATPase, T2SS/T4P/T4SS family [Actinomycetes bacterium]